MNPLSGVYRIRNVVSNKSYIGSSQDIQLRWKEHRRMLLLKKHHCRHLQHAWNKHGETAFVFEILEEYPIHQLSAREQHWLQTTPKRYNVSICVESPMRGCRHKAKTRTRMSRSHKQFWSDPLRRETSSKTNKARCRAPEIRQRLLNTLAAVVSNPISLQKRSLSIKKAYAFPKMRRRMSEISKQRWKNPEMRKKTVRAMRSTWSDPSLRKRQSETLKRTYANPALRQQRSAILKKACANPLTRQKKSDIGKKIWRTAERRAQMSRISTNTWKDPNIRAKRLAGLHKLFTDKAFCRRRADALKQRWQNDPVLRSRQSETMKRYWKKKQEPR